MQKLVLRTTLGVVLYTGCWFGYAFVLKNTIEEKIQSNPSIVAQNIAIEGFPFIPTVAIYDLNITAGASQTFGFIERTAGLPPRSLNADNIPSVVTEYHFKKVNIHSNIDGSHLVFQPQKSIEMKTKGPTGEVLEHHTTFDSMKIDFVTDKDEEKEGGLRLQDVRRCELVTKNYVTKEINSQNYTKIPTLTILYTAKNENLLADTNVQVQMPSADMLYNGYVSEAASFMFNVGIKGSNFNTEKNAFEMYTLNVDRLDLKSVAADFSVSGTAALTITPPGTGLDMDMKVLSFKKSAMDTLVEATRTEAQKLGLDPQASVAVLKKFPEIDLQAKFSVHPAKAQFYVDSIDAKFPDYALKAQGGLNESNNQMTILVEKYEQFVKNIINTAKDSTNNPVFLDPSVQSYYVQLFESLSEAKGEQREVIVHFDNLQPKIKNKTAEEIAVLIQAPLLPKKSG